MISQKIKPVVALNHKNIQELKLGSHQLIDQQYERLCIFIESIQACCEVHLDTAKAPSRKLARLNIGQLKELLVDVCDEIGRRTVGDSVLQPFLEIRLEYSAKRNQARQKLGDLNQKKLAELVNSLKFELEGRFPELRAFQQTLRQETGEKGHYIDARQDLKHENFEKSAFMSSSLISLPELENSSYNLTTAKVLTKEDINEAIEASTASSSSGLSPLLASQHFSPKDQAHVCLRPGVSQDKNKRQTVLDKRLILGQTFNFDCLDSLIQDLNAIIGQEQNSEMETLKQRHAKELESLRDYIKHLEGHVLPEKNHEIAKLTAVIEQKESRLSLSRHENARLCTELGEKEELVQKQSILIKNVQSAYIELQHQLGASLTPTGDINQKDSTLVFINKSLSGTWGDFEKHHHLALKTLENPSSTTADKLYSIKDVCYAGQKIVRDTERSIARFNGGKRESSGAQLNFIIEAKTLCMQSLSYCVACCKDLGKKVKAGKEVIDALEDLKLQTKTLVDAIELATVHPLPSFPISDKCREENQENLEESRAETLKCFANAARFKTDQTVAVFQSLRNFVESQKTDESNELIQVPSQMRSNINEAMVKIGEFEESGRGVLSSDQLSDVRAEIQKSLGQLNDAGRKLHLSLLNGSGVLSDEDSCRETINACNGICSSLHSLQRYMDPAFSIDK